MRRLLVLSIVLLFAVGFQPRLPAEDTNLRVTLNVNAYGRSVSVYMNGIELKKVTGGHAQAIQLYHENHPMLDGAPEDYKTNFCLKQGKNTIKIIHKTVAEEDLMTLDISIQAIGYDVSLLEYKQPSDVKAGETAGVFDLHSKQPEGFKTIILK